MLQLGQTVSVEIEKPAAGGRMIARVDGQVMLVAGAIPGERVLARVDRVSKGVVYASATTILEPSRDRVAVVADPQCGGCLFAHIEYDRQLELKALIIADAFARIGRLPLSSPVTVAASPVDGYRMRARLHRRGRRFGFFREATHELCDARQTRQLLPATCDIIDRLGDELTRAGAHDVDEVEIAENVDASERVVHLLGTGGGGPALGAEGFSLEGLTGMTAAMPSGGCRVLSGSPYVTDLIEIDLTDVADPGSRSVIAARRHVSGFFQGNRFLLRALVAHVVEQVPIGSTVIDLYAGGGLFAVAAARARQARVTAVEGERVGAEDLILNAISTDGAVVHAVHQSVETFVQSASPDADVVIMDPPRTGLSREALDGIVRLRPRRLVYVSCDVATLARDARRIVDAGYEIRGTRAFDLFPVTAHVESVVVFEM